MKRLEIKGVDMAFLTLHVGLGNFRTVDVEDLTKHKMDSEQVVIPERTAEAVNRVKRAGGKVCAVGTTVMRSVESSVSTEGFIFSPYEFSVANCMITNFHLPYSTQLMMVAAFAGYDALMSAYDVAKKEKYRFGTYGDAMLIL